MYVLKEKNFINKNQFSIWTDDKAGNHSHIIFGGYENLGTDPEGEGLKFLRTTSS
jgi:hypothetical protein